MSQKNLKPRPSPTSCSPAETAVFTVLNDTGAKLSRELVQTVLADQRDALTSLIRFSVSSPIAYTRRSVFRGDHFEALVLTWMPGQRSPIHNHRGSVCGVLVLEGTATEISFAESAIGLLSPTRSEEAGLHSVTVSEDQEMHMIANLGPTPLVTLHLYSPPLHGMEVFSLERTIFHGYPQLLLDTRPTGPFLLPSLEVVRSNEDPPIQPPKVQQSGPPLETSQS